jgi:hypothetical protein
MTEPIHYARAIAGGEGTSAYSYRTACGEYVEDVERHVSDRARVTCKNCLAAHKGRTYAIANCQACRAEFVWVVPTYATTEPRRCAPCRHLQKALYYEEQANAHRKKAVAARAPRDAFVAEIKRRGWTTVLEDKNKAGAR